jgi:hypothetical protein
VGGAVVGIEAFRETNCGAVFVRRFINGQVRATRQPLSGLNLVGGYTLETAIYIENNRIGCISLLLAVPMF